MGVAEFDRGGVPVGTTLSPCLTQGRRAESAPGIGRKRLGLMAYLIGSVMVIRLATSLAEARCWRGSAPGLQPAPLKRRGP